MAFWDNVGTALFGKSAQEFDPYAKDRAVRMDMLKRSMAGYDQMLSQPLGFIDPAMRAQMQGDVEESVRSANPGAGQSGFLNDRLARARNDLNMKLAETNINQANKQRDYIQQLSMANQPTQMGKREVGMLEQFGGQMANQAAQGFGKAATDWGTEKIFGRSKDEDEIKPPSGGMSVR